MKHANQRNIKIIDELMFFSYKYGSSNIQINTHKDSEAVYINFKAEIENLPDDILEMTSNLLFAPRCHEMEEYYWNLTGDDDTECELMLVGMMTDEATLEYKDNKYLEINLKRYM